MGVLEEDLFFWGFFLGGQALDHVFVSDLVAVADF